MGKLPYDVFGADDSHKKDTQKREQTISGPLPSFKKSF